MKELVDNLEEYLKLIKLEKDGDEYVNAWLALIHDKIEEYLFKIKYYEKA